MLDDELRELAEEADEETERYLERLRKQREAEAKKERELGRFGRVYPIGRDDYTREVTEASMENEPGEVVQAEDEDLEDDDRKGDGDKPKKGLGTGVVCFLYKDGCVVCWYTMMSGWLTASAQDPAVRPRQAACRNPRGAASTHEVRVYCGRQVHPEPAG